MVKIAYFIIFKDMGRLGPTEIILIVAALLLLFGGKKIPELMKGLGSGLNEFKKASKGDEATTTTTNEEDKK